MTKYFNIILISGLIIVSITWSIMKPGFDSISALITALLGISGYSIYKNKKQQLNVTTFKPSEAKRFYNSIANSYDVRNSDYLKKSHLETVVQLKSSFPTDANYKILDLGGGTGINIAAHFSYRKNTTWHYVDASEEMKKLFELNMKDSDMKKQTHNVEIEDFISNTDEKYDAIILSFVLTSMISIPNMNVLSRMLNAGGCIIISEIEPEYTAKYPNYNVKLNQNIYSLSMTPVNPLDLIEMSQNAGLYLKTCKSIKKNDDVRYSYILVLSKA